MTRRCVVCSKTEKVHPEVGDGYVPHPFEPADYVHSEAYEGPERRQLVRRMDDRVAAVEQVVERVNRGGHR